MDEKFSYNLISVTLNKKCGVLNMLGKTIIPIDYEKCIVILDHLVIITKNGKQGVINTKVGGIDEKTKKVIPFELIVPIKYDFITRQNDYLLKTELNSKYGLINIYGFEILPCEYDVIGMFDNKKAEVFKSDNTSFFIDEKGIVVHK